MAPNGENLIGSFRTGNNNNVPPKPRVSTEGLQRTISDISFELAKESTLIDKTDAKTTTLPPITEVEDAKCECCGMSEEFTTEYINRVRAKFLGKMICGLCAEAVHGEMEKNGGNKEDALNEHMNACVRFNRFGRTHPVLYQAEAMKNMLKKSKSTSPSVYRAKSHSPRDKRGGIARSSSCIPAITRQISDLKMVN